jgi:hypothetical protein
MINTRGVIFCTFLAGKNVESIVIVKYRPSVVIIDDMDKSIVKFVI